MVILHKGKAEIENQIISEEEEHWDINFKFSYYISDLTKKKKLDSSIFHTQLCPFTFNTMFKLSCSSQNMNETRLLKKKESTVSRQSAFTFTVQKNKLCQYTPLCGLNLRVQFF